MHSRLEVGQGVSANGATAEAGETSPPTNLTRYFRDTPLPSSRCLGKCKTLGSDLAIIDVLHPELCSSGQSQVLRIETFSCVYQKMQRKTVPIQPPYSTLYTSLPELGSSRNP